MSGSLQREQHEKKNRTKKEKQAKNIVQRKKDRQLYKEVIAYRKSKKRIINTDATLNQEEYEEEEELETYSYDEMHLAFSSEDI